jgi:hypothetical protein
VAVAPKPRSAALTSSFFLPFFFSFFDLDFFENPVPKARSASRSEDEELLNEKNPRLVFFFLLVFFTSRFIARFSELDVKKEVNPPTDLGAGREKSTKEESEEDSLRR